MNQSEQKKKVLSPIRLMLLILCSGSLALSGVLYAAGIFPSLGTPTGQVPAFSTRLTSISHACPTASFIKGFDDHFAPICVHYSTPNTSVPSFTGGAFSTPPTGGMPGGKFGTYFNNLLNICSGNGVLKGFTSQGKKICVSAVDRTTLTDSPTDTAFGTPSVVGSATPAGEDLGGAFQTYFNKMFAAPCGTEQGVTGIQADGTLTCAAIPVPTCVVTTCSAASPACDTTTYGTDNCGNACSKVGVVCGGGGGGGGVTCPAGSANNVLSPDQSPGIANSCDFTWEGGTWDGTVGSSLVAVGTNNGTAGGTCNKYGNWDYFFNCPNRAPGALNCVGGGYLISSSDTSNECQFYWSNLLDGQSESISSITGIPGGGANGSCNAGAWTYSYSCPNRVTPSCPGGGAQWGDCSFNWGPATAGGGASADGFPYGHISASCDANGNWVDVNVSCP